MARKSRNSTFDQTLETLRAHSFDLAPFPGVAGGVQVSKHGAAAVLVAAKDAPVAFVQSPGALVGGEVARHRRSLQRVARHHQRPVPI